MNEHNVAKNIIISCGQIVELVIYYLEGSVKSVKEINLSDNPVTVRNKLNHLSGRKFNDSAKSYEIVDENPIISKKASEYAYRAYTLRNQASLFTKPLVATTRQGICTNRLLPHPIL